MNFLDQLKIALSCKNKQAHRLTGNSKKGRQQLAADKNQQDIVQPELDNVRVSIRGSVRKSYSKRDI